MNKKVITLIKFLISIVLITYLINKIGLINIINSIKDVNLILLPLIFLILFANFLIGAVNIKIMLIALGGSLTFVKTLKYYLKSWAYGLFLPGKLGEFSLVYYLKQENISFSKGIIIALLDKLITLIVVFSLAITGLFKLLELNNFILVLVLFLLIIILILFFTTKKGRIFITKYIIRKYADKFEGFYDNLDFLVKERKLFLLLNVLLTVLKWFIMFIVIYLWFISLGYTVPFLVIVSAMSVGVIVSLLPISIGGLGVKENSSLLVFSQYGIYNVVAGTVLLLNTILKYILALIIIYL